MGPRTEHSATVGLRLGAGTVRDERGQWAASVVLELPTDGWATNQAAKRAGPPRELGFGRGQPKWPTADRTSSPKAKGLKPTKPDQPGRPSRVEPGRTKAAPSLTTTEPVRRPQPPARAYPPLSAADIRGALQAGHRTARLAEIGVEIDGLAERARWSAALPQLRLRVTRSVDESTSLSPTSYDAERTTARGGASLWLEARTTWELDRAIFSSEELRLQGLRQKLEQQQQALDDKVVALLFAWQTATLKLHTVAPEEPCLQARLRQEQLAAELDLLTGGWLWRWRLRRPEQLEPPACDWR